MREFRSAILGIGALCFATSCAPAGYHYGSWSDGPVAAFTLSSNAQMAQGFTSNGQPITREPPSQDQSTISAAIKSYCAKSTKAACSFYFGEVTKCEPLAINAYSVLMYVRAMKRGGLTPQQAAEQAIRTFAMNTTLPLSPDDLEYIALAAADFPDIEQPITFRENFLNLCIDAADK